MQAIKCTLMFSWRRIEQMHHFQQILTPPDVTNDEFDLSVYQWRKF